MLAVLFHGLDDDARRQLVSEYMNGKLEKISLMEKIAEALEVSLRTNNNHGGTDLSAARTDLERLEPVDCSTNKDSSSESIYDERART
ncbi:hypothetical protein LTR05_008334 [Lithohypha guttulata]|uniref:Uncharacterized protein n=2 Tax=Lithohypha guttulata TaxID=1690604 RepID=A0AAN7STG0_9EURO|nr:hypothetical protein LTR05_008334 [Lithohypha guttulata]